MCVTCDNSQDGNFSTSWTCAAADLGDGVECTLDFDLFYYRHIKQIKIGELCLVHHATFFSPGVTHPMSARRKKTRTSCKAAAAAARTPGGLSACLPAVCGKILAYSLAFADRWARTAA